MPPRVLGWHLLLTLPLLAGACIPAPAQNGTARLNVSAGPDREVNMGQSATLSADVNGRTSGFAFSWEQQTGPVADVALEDASRAQTQAGPFDTLGEYKFRVLAATKDGTFGQDFLVLTVVEPGDNDNQNDNDSVNDNEVTTDGNDNLGTDGNDNMDTDGNDNVSTDGNNNDNSDDQPEVDPDRVLVRINAALNLPVGIDDNLTATRPLGGLEASYLWQVLAGDATIEELTERETTIRANSEGNVTVRVTMTVPEFNRDYTDEVNINVEPEGTFRVFITGQSEGVSGTLFDFRSFFGNAPSDGILARWEVIQGEGTFASPNIPVPKFTPTSEGIVVVQITNRVPTLGDLQAVDDFVLVVFPETEVDLVVTVNTLAVIGEPTSIPVTTPLFDEDDLNFQWEVISGDASIDDPTSASPQVVITTADTAELLISVNAVINDVPRSGSQTVFVTGVENLSPRVDIQVTDFGTITLELDGQAAPQTVANLLHYVDSRFFDGLTFHRNACSDDPSSGECDPFVLQGGRFELVDGELVSRDQGLRDPVPSEADNGLTNGELHSIAMALSGNNADSGTSQFFINLTDNSLLDGLNFTVFGRVAQESIPVVDAIVATERVENTALSGEVSRPVPDVIMEQVRRAP